MAAFRALIALLGLGSDWNRRSPSHVVSASRLQKADSRQMHTTAQRIGVVPNTALELTHPNCSPIKVDVRFRLTSDGASRVPVRVVSIHICARNPGSIDHEYLSALCPRTPMPASGREKSRMPPSGALIHAGARNTWQSS